MSSYDIIKIPIGKSIVKSVGALIDHLQMCHHDITDNVNSTITQGLILLQTVFLYSQNIYVVKIVSTQKA